MSTEKIYTAAEERWNVITHGTGFIIAFIASYLLLNKVQMQESQLRFNSYLVYCFGLILLYLASTIFHSAKDPGWRKRLNVFDHSAIYILIAGTYTPITLLSIKGTSGLIILCVVWILALTGVVLKLFFTGQYSKISTITYVLMGWLIVIAIKPLINSIETPGLLWLLAGGISYSIGAIFYQKNR